MSARCIVILLAVVITGCSAFSHTNIPEEGEVPESRATFNIDTSRGNDDTLFILAFSGGGSRAAYLSASVMLALDKRDNMLGKVDAISSVSGGSLPAAYYVISSDAEPAKYGRLWNEDTVRDLMSRNYTARWFGNWFWPNNIGKYWFTAYDRTDIMAQTLADNLYDTIPRGHDLKMGDLLPDRPYLILNATNGTNDHFGESFTFTTEDFATIHSDLQDYELARAVMGTATFPGVFSYMTLANYATGTDKKPQYTHIFDGGNSDNLGIKSVSRILRTLDEEGKSYKRLIVMLVDAYTGKSGVSNDDARSRKPLDLVIDTNFIDATDSLLASNRGGNLISFKEELTKRVDGNPELAKRAVFYHLQFADSNKYKKKLWKIPTNFTISEDNACLIEKFVNEIMDQDNTCLSAIKTILSGGSYEGDLICEHTHLPGHHVDSDLSDRCAGNSFEMDGKGTDI